MEKFTPRGLTQNWNFIQQYHTSKKAKKGEFVSRKIRLVSLPSNEPKTATRADEDSNIKFSVKVSENGEVKVFPRKNGKFSGKTQVYSASLATKLGL